MRTHRNDEIGDKVIWSLCIQKGPHNLGGLARVDLLHIPLDETKHIVAEEVLRQVFHHIKAITHVDQRPSVRQLCLDEEALDLVWRVRVALTSNALNLWVQ